MHTRRPRRNMSALSGVTRRRVAGVRPLAGDGGTRQPMDYRIPGSPEGVEQLMIRGSCRTAGPQKEQPSAALLSRMPFPAPPAAVGAHRTAPTRIKRIRRAAHEMSIALVFPLLRRTTS